LSTQVNEGEIMLNLLKWYNSLSFLYARAFLNAYGLWLSQKPSTLVSFFRKKRGVAFFYKEISLASSSQKLIADSLIDKSLNAMKLVLIECRLQKGLI